MLWYHRGTVVVILDAYCYLVLLIAVVNKGWLYLEYDIDGVLSEIDQCSGNG